jgi:hypothetical protein
MGSGSFSLKSYADYSTSRGKLFNVTTSRIDSGQVFESKRLDESLNPKRFTVRECANSDEHPNTIPVILALDVTGSMGDACTETASALGVIITNLYKEFKDIEFCVMGIGDLAYDEAPVQMSQFESDVRIAEALDKIYMEHGGGGNRFESYTAAWYMGLKRTKLDSFDKQGRKGIIITMGDEPLNPYLPVSQLNGSTNSKEQADVDTNDLYKLATEKFDIYHIAVDSPHDSYRYYADDIKESFGKLLGDNFKVSTINNLSNTIEECIKNSLNDAPVAATEEPSKTLINENGEIEW